MIVDTKDIYSYCNLFILLKMSSLLIKIYLNFILVMEVAIIVDNNFIVTDIFIIVLIFTILIITYLLKNIYQNFD